MSSIYDSKKIKARKVIPTSDPHIFVRNLQQDERMNMSRLAPPEDAQGEELLNAVREMHEYLFNYVICDKDGNKFQEGPDDLDGETFDYVIRVSTDVLNRSNSQKK